MGLRNTDIFLVNRGNQSYKMAASEIGDFVLTVPPDSSKPNNFIVNDGALKLVSADGNIVKKKFSANQPGDSNLTFSDGITINNQGDIVLDPDWFTNNTPGINDGELRLVDEGTGIVHKVFSANQKSNTKLKFKGADIDVNGNQITIDTDSVKEVTLWGQPHDHKGNVKGDMTSVKSITGANAPLVIQSNDGNDNWDVELLTNVQGSNIILGSTGTLGQGGHIKFLQGADQDAFRFYPSSGVGYGVLDFGNLTDSKKYRFPDKSGNVALLSDINDGWLIFKQGVAEVARYRASRLRTEQGDNGSNITVNLGTGGGGGGGGAATAVELWGQLHDHTGNVKGDMKNVDSILGGNTELIVKSKGGYDAHFHSGNNADTKFGTHTNGNIRFFTKGVNGYKFHVPGSTALNASFNFTQLTADRNFKWQDEAGTVALTKDIGTGVYTFKDSNGIKIGEVDVNSDTGGTINIPTTTGGGGGSSNSDGSINVAPGPGGTTEVSVNQVKLWGQDHNHVGNVTGTLEGAANVYGQNSNMEIRPKDSGANRNLKLSGNTNNNSGAGGNVEIGESHKGKVRFKTGVNAGYEFYKEKNDSIVGKFNFQNLTETHTYSFQNKTGTLAHLDDIKNGKLIIETTDGDELGQFTANASGTTRIQVPAGDGGGGGGGGGGETFWQETTLSDNTIGLRPNSGTYTAVVPRNNTTSLGMSDKRWSDVWTNDLHLSNEGKTNDVDGTWGDWTIQEGNSNLYIINNKTGDKFKFLLEKVN